jgi:hypothetical protein
MGGVGGTGGAGGAGGAGGVGGMGGVGGTGGTPDPEAECDEGLCLTDDDLAALCEDAVAECIANNPEVNWEECILGIVGIVCGGEPECVRDTDCNAEEEEICLDEECVTLTNLVIEPENGTVGVGETVQYTATATFDNDAVRDYTNSVFWDSNSQGIATVSNDPGEIGQVTGVSPGTVGITARDTETNTVAEVDVTVTGP